MSVLTPLTEQDEIILLREKAKKELTQKELKLRISTNVRFQLERRCKEVLPRHIHAWPDGDSCYGTVASVCYGGEFGDEQLSFDEMCAVLRAFEPSKKFYYSKTKGHVQIRPKGNFSLYQGRKESDLDIVDAGYYKWRVSGFYMGEVSKICYLHELYDNEYVEICLVVRSRPYVHYIIQMSGQNGCGDRVTYNTIVCSPQYILSDAEYIQAWGRGSDNYCHDRDIIGIPAENAEELITGLSLTDEI